MHTNALINETSPYLLQHAHNPVNWFAWNDDTLKKAQSENKMLLISIGYAACHWCHVMEHECFENKEVADVMNKYFICIKVDREERPDVDQIYMDAALLINGNGGWPLNALALPDGKPFFAGTYYPKDHWIQLLEYFAELFENEKEKLFAQAEQLSAGIVQMGKIPLVNDQADLSIQDLDEMFSLFEKRIDAKNGGTHGAVKFPMPSVWEFLLHYHHISGNKKALVAVETTLTNMAKAGIYDQVGGGFSRYATDVQWHVPHFEKMLYDNGQLLSLYSHAYQVTKDPIYKRIVYETIEFANRELLSPEGGFYSSLDADSEGKEGRFYVWTEQEIKDMLGKDAGIYLHYYGITSNGNWEEKKNIPDINFGSKENFIDQYLSVPDLDVKLKEMNKILLAEREKRTRPATDDKVLTSWNALMSIGLLDAYRAFGEEAFFATAKKNIDFLLKNVCANDGSLYRNYKNGNASIPAFLDDHALLIAALINYYQVSFEEEYLHKAHSLMKYCIQHFYDQSSGMFFYTNDLFTDLIARKMETSDNVIPSSNSVIASCLQTLGMYFENEGYLAKAKTMCNNILEETKKNVGYYSNWAISIINQMETPYEIAVTGVDWKSKLAGLQVHYLPNAIFSGGINQGKLNLLQNKLVEGKTMIYVCKNKTCQLPVEKVADALLQIK